MTCVHKEYAVKVKMIQGQRSVETEVFIGLYLENHYLVGREINIWWGRSTWLGGGGGCDFSGGSRGNFWQIFG